MDGIVVNYIINYDPAVPDQLLVKCFHCDWTRICALYRTADLLAQHHFDEVHKLVSPITSIET